MIRYNGRRNWKDLLLPVVIVIAFVNPFVESLQTINPIIFMLDHYALYFAGILIGYKFFKGSLLSLIIGIIPAGFWHIPLFFALSAAFPFYRDLEEATLFLGGILAGSFIPRMSLTFKVVMLGVYMFADSLLSIFFVLGYPQYSNVDYKFLAWGTGILPFVGIEMFIVMNIILVYSLYKLLKNISFF